MQGDVTLLQGYDSVAGGRDAIAGGRDAVAGDVSTHEDGVDEELQLADGDARLLGRVEVPHLAPFDQWSNPAVVKPSSGGQTKQWFDYWSNQHMIDQWPNHAVV